MKVIRVKEIAFKAKTSIIAQIFGASYFVLFSFLSISIKPKGWIFYFLLSIIISIVFVWGFCHELKRPNCLIKMSDSILWIYSNKIWNECNTFDIISVKYRKTKSGRIVLNSGTLEIKTMNSLFRLSNVKDVEDVALILQKNKQLEINND